ncbi:MAG: prepilin-type N-terminal cleavage/methylation domain-containing protein [Patescibacteria group bacterium]
MPKGFTLLEMLLALGIIAIIAVVSITSLSRVNTDKALSVEADKALSLLARARSATLSAKDGFAYSIHFEERMVVLFKGAGYSSGAQDNISLTLNEEVKISAIALTGGGSDVVFKKLTGATTQNGTVTLASIRDGTKTKVITIEATGIAYSN